MLRKRQDKFQHWLSHQREEGFHFIWHSQRSWLTCKIYLFWKKINKLPSFWHYWLSQTNHKYCPILNKFKIPNILKNMVALTKVLSKIITVYLLICIQMDTKHDSFLLFLHPPTFILMVCDRSPRCLRNSTNDIINNTLATDSSLRPQFIRHGVLLAVPSLSCYIELSYYDPPNSTCIFIEERNSPRF